ncbi:aprataxin and PNK-like factor isoform X2 [Thunnus maccoyii]|uniref:aprataxin and PNK-like factor isoform X2 n=1 Tax=Thunnus maccoyii TaxID=8240 RepID=UPI001C4C353F|nr:aprataxin and PNK-like factor isoform X2 [Thunnus maccoyii]
MSGFSLLPVDGGDPIPLPPGETVLGRGPLLRVNDKRVSRHHGLLENLDGRLRLKPTHLNPCFVRSSLTDDPRPLQKDTWHPLHHGDLFSLLPGQFVYKVVAPSQSFEEEEDLPVSPEPDVKPTPAIRQNREQTPPCEEATLAALSNEEEEEEEADSPNRKLKEVENDQRDVAPPAPKRRVLPAWMMAAVAAPHTSSSSSSPKAVKRRKEPAAASTSTKRAAAKQATPTTTSSPEGAELSEEEEEEMPKKKRRRRKMSDEEEAKSKTEPAVGLQSEPDKTQEESDNESDNFAMEVEEEGRGGETSAADRSSTTRTSDASGSKNNKTTKNGQTTSKKAKNGGSASKPGLRTACPYGKDCYRKNPVHFQECSHPGDTDYEEEEEKEEEEEEEADRPECPYGTDCYRKNPLHRKEYKHTKRPARTTRTVPKSSPADDDDFEDDDDGFINDSEDAGDDSDYAPPDSDDSGKEDIKRLQREAKTFLKRKK